MLPQSLLSKIKLSAGAASMVFMFSNAACKAEEKPAAAPPPQPIAIAAEPALTDAQLKVLQTNLPLLAADDYDARDQAATKILELGKAAVGPLKEALKTAQDAEVKARIETIIAEQIKPKVVVRPGPARVGCERCGRG
jgi:hypothetical protein